ncbi:MAG TPA: hypothetical protein VHO29_08895 [Marmoricola sp.]|nr:hypothetical protein [Marmoricola sp.]
MAKKTRGYRSMGTRSVSFTLTFSVDGARNVTDAAFRKIESAIEEAIEGVVRGSVLAYPVTVETTYNRQVEVREPYALD